MLLLLRRLVITGVCAVLVLGGLTVTAEASGVPRVSGVYVAGQDWYHAKLKIKWNAVRGATYQVRWAPTKTRLRAAKRVAARRASTYAGPLNRGRTSYVQVRAVKSGRAGAWSAAKAVRFRNRWPSKPKLSGYGVPGGARFTWGYTPNASRYRMRWAAGPFGNWEFGATAWLPQAARSATFRYPSTPRPGDHMLGVAYANPVWGRLEANNAYLKGATRVSDGWKPIFPTAPDPGTGDGLRMGTYNVMLYPDSGVRVNAIAANIRDHGLDIVALQEADLGTAKAVVAKLPAGWAYAPSGTSSGQQILYRTAEYRIEASGTFAVPNPKPGSSPLVTPWVRLAPVSPASSESQSLYVVSVHLAENPNASQMQKKKDAGNAATAAMAAINGINSAGKPVIVAGDLRYLREPYNDVAGYVEAPPTFVRGGYYDAMAAVRKVNYQYTTMNGGNGTTASRQTAARSGVAARSDYIMVKGFRGSNAYTNVVNWSSSDGVVPSDHNLVYADLTVPFAP